MSSTEKSAALSAWSVQWSTFLDKVLEIYGRGKDTGFTDNTSASRS